MFQKFCICNTTRHKHHHHHKNTATYETMLHTYHSADTGTCTQQHSNVSDNQKDYIHNVNIISSNNISHDNSTAVCHILNNQNNTDTYDELTVPVNVNGSVTVDTPLLQDDLILSIYEYLDVISILR